MIQTLLIPLVMGIAQPEAGPPPSPEAAQVAAVTQAPAQEATPSAPASQEAQALLASVRNALAPEIQAGRAGVTVNADRIKITLQEAVSASGQGFALNNAGNRAIEALVPVIREASGWGIEVRGHSSTAPQDRAEEQRRSQAMADAVAQPLTQRLGRGSGAVSARGMGSGYPVDTNSTWEGQQLNDRVEIYLLPPNYPEHPRPLFPLSEQEV